MISTFNFQKKTNYTSDSLHMASVQISFLVFRLFYNSASERPWGSTTVPLALSPENHLSLIILVMQL